ncbi:MAG: helix-turn-helix transcriptional regulator [Sphingomonas sp.]|nr:helix-turn-helix transcriptional regulator [Sphingomonas sp.]
MLTSFIRPARDLAEIVACFRQRVSPAGVPAITLALPARPELFVEFYLATPYSARTAAGLDTAPAIALVGPSTAYHTDIRIGGAIDTFTIKFQPTAMHRLFGLPGRLLVDRAEDARAVEAGFGDLRARLGDVQDFGVRVEIAQLWLRNRLRDGREVGPIDRAARLIRRSSGQVDLDSLAERCGMGARHFRRCFAEAVGVSPKAYSRITRFHAALDFRGRHPDVRWTEIAQRFGYFDQSHMLRDARHFADGMTLSAHGRPGADAARSVSSYFAQ